MTAAEFRLWKVLRQTSVSSWRFRRQSPVGPYIADFLCPRLKLIVEVDGDQHGYAGAERQDAERTAWLESQGFRVLRVGNRDVASNLEGVWRVIMIVCDERARALGIHPATDQPPP